MKTIKILQKCTDFRNWKVYIVEGDEESIRRYFELKYPDMGIAVLEHLNANNLFEICIIPEETEQ